MGVLTNYSPGCTFPEHLGVDIAFIRMLRTFINTNIINFRRKCK